MCFDVLDFLLGAVPLSGTFRQLWTEVVTWMRRITYPYALFLLSSQLVWVLLAIAMKPERAIPTTASIAALLVHWSRLYRRLGRVLEKANFVQAQVDCLREQPLLDEKLLALPLRMGDVDKIRADLKTTLRMLNPTTSLNKVLDALKNPALKKSRPYQAPP